MPRQFCLLVFAFAVFKVVLHLFANHNYGFHADELYYIALSKHMQWGYLDNGPFTPFVAFASNILFGNSLFAYRLISTLASGATVVVVGYMAFYLNGKKLAICLACFAAICSPAYLATGYFLQPVVFEQLFWSGLALCLIRYRQTEKEKYLYMAAVVLGLGILNKYTILMYLIALLPACLNFRKLWRPALLTILIVSPNIAWQAGHHFPALHYVNMVRSGAPEFNFGEFLFQFTFFHGAGVAVWLAGLAYLFLNKPHHNYRFASLAFIITLVLLLAVQGKIYYGLGAFPVLFAAGGVCWEHMLLRRSKIWHYGLYTTFSLTTIISLPAVIPILPYQLMLKYFTLMHTYTNITSIFKWEDGRVHEIPQTYADMLGWEKLESLPSNVIYTDDYGIAGAISYYNPKCKVVAPNNSFVQWSPATLDGFAYVYLTKRPGTQNQLILTKSASAQLNEQYRQQRQIFKGD